MMKPFKIILLLLFLICDHSIFAQEEQEVPSSDESFSDLVFEELYETSAVSQRNPFAPGVIQEEFDPNALIVEGIVIGPEIKSALISGQIVSVGERLGNYTVKDVQPGKIILQQLEDDYEVKMESYQPYFEERTTGKYYVEFHNASLGMALSMLAKADAVNMIIPQDIAGKVSVAFNNTQMIDVIGAVLRVNNLEYAVENDIMRIGKAEQFKDGSDLKAIAIPLNYATAKEMEALVKTFLSSRGSSTFDERTNTVIVKDMANVIDSVSKFLVAVDRKDPQVSIEAKIIDASSNFSRALGIQWGLTTGQNNVVLRGNQDAGSITGSSHEGTLVNLKAANPTSGVDILVGRLPGNASLQMQLSAAEATGAIRIISKPNVTTINNKQASISSGLTIYVKVESGTDEGPTLQEINTGIELKVTPQITLNHMIKMVIEATESEADFSRTVDGIPAIINNKAETTVLIPDGETAVIGGLLKVKTTKDRKKVPGLGDVPVLGWLFKNTTKTKNNNELMIFITPRILDTQHYQVGETSLDSQ